MPFIADLHIHSRYSRATSRDMVPESLWRWAQLKGISVIGSGDITHPEWLKELKDKLRPARNGLFHLKRTMQSRDVPDSCKSDVYFLLSAEVSCIYSKNGMTRKIHSILLCRDFKDAESINAALSKIGNLSADGRPILGLDAKRLLEIVLDTSPDAMLIPAHVWTPHFSVFGASSGFDSLEECFEELTPHIHAIETGLSSDPEMNWRLSALDRITLLSNSDAHSPNKIGREANIFDTDISFDAILNAIKTRRGLSGTIEFFPEEGKYHFDGHRECGVSLSPDETVKQRYLCPVCGKRVTVGVMHRVEVLADRPHGFKPRSAPPFYSIIPLPEVISEVVNAGVNTKKVADAYRKLLDEIGNEFTILLDTPLRTIEQAGSPRLREAIARVRSKNVSINPGFDGEYGKIEIFGKIEKRDTKGQGILL